MTAVGTALALVVTALVSVPAVAAPRGDAAKAQAAPDRSTPVSKVAVKAATRSASDDAVLRAAPPASFPAAGSADLPVRVLADGSADAAPRTSRERSASQAQTPVRVTVLDQSAATAAGVRGVLLQVSRADGRAGRAGAGLSVSYAKFAAAYGAGFGSRLRLVSLPDCALTTPAVQDCRTQTPVGSVNDTAARTVTAATVSVGSASASSSLLALASASDGSSAEADWKATDLSPAYSWASGTAGGDFSLNYPIKAPAALGGPAPQLAFSYSSGSVDAKTAAKTGQSSVVGEGWDLAGGGYIERTYRQCSEDGLNIPDQCWVDKNTITMVFGGRSTKLIWNGSGWYAAEDDKLKIENPTGAGNNAPNGEYWRITTQDGTQYNFGLVRRYAGDNVNPDTASVLFEPVFGNNSGEPCYPNWCLQAYRWNLDYVVDPRGNTMTYFYDKFVGRYGPIGVGYDLSARLNRIEYGTRAGSEAATTAPMRVAFDYAERCFAPNPCSWPPSSGNGGFADTPTDLNCTGSSCPNVTAPVHFSHSRLAAVRTQVYTGSAYRNVDQWDLEQTFLTSGDSNGDGSDDTAPNLWLSGLTHTGYAADGTTTLAEPKVTFGGVRLDNRTDWSTGAGTAPFRHWRISKVANGSGGETLVDYLAPDCVNGQTKMNGDSNPLRCFPQYIKPPTAAAGFAYFNKYVVDKVTERDLTGGAPDEVTSYAYSTEGSSDTALWAHDDVDVANVAQTSWADWRGYPTVTVTHGAVAGQQTVTKTVYHRGLHGDAKKSGDDTQVLYAQRPAFTLESLQQGAEIPVGLAGGGTPGNGSQCLDIQNAVNADGAVIQVTSCNSLDWQKWIRRFDTSGRPTLQNPVTGKCLDVKNSGTANATQVWLYTCNNGVAQVWMRQPDGSLKNPNSGRCLDAGGATMYIWDCNGLWSQVWMPTAKSELVRSQAVRCAGAPGTGDGSPVQSQACGTTDNTTAQTWQLQRNGSVLNPATGKCLDVLSSGTANGTIVQLWTCNQGPAQQWTAQADGSLKNPNSGRCLDAGSGVGLVINDCTGGGLQKWVGRTQDHSALNGQVRTTYALNNGAVDNVTVHRYTTTFTASRNAFTNPGAGIYSFMTRETQTKTSTWIASSSSWRWTQSDTTFDGYGLSTDVKDWGDVSAPGDDRCTHFDYARNTATGYLVNLLSQSVTTDCAAGPHDGNYLRGTQTLYDGSLTAGAAPSLGLATQTMALTGATGTTLAWTKQGRTTYDANGRAQDGFDALEHKTMTRYTPATGGPVTAITVTNALGHVRVSTVEPGHGTTTSVLDANNQTTTVQYDPLGRRTKVWLPGRSTSLTANAEYAYALTDTAPNTLTAKVLGPNGNQIVTTTLYDGRLRQRQTQSPAAQAKGGRIVSDTAYDARGLGWQHTTFWDGANPPGAALAGFADTSVHQQTRTTFDNRQRPTVDGLYDANVLRSQTTNSYDGDSTTTTPPAGGVPVKRTFDAAGNVITQRQYTAGSTAGAFQDTTYQYDHLGQRTRATEAGGNQWTTTYDRLGRVTASTDPDSGSASATYDVKGRVATSTDGRNLTLAYSYDDLDRKTGVFEGSTSGVQRIGWVYDTVRKGALTSSTRFSGTVAYTTTVDSYDPQGRVLSTTTSLPLVANAPTGTYTTTASYNVDGALATTGYPAIGGLASETVSYTYDSSGRPLAMTGLDTYIADTSYYGLGAPYQQVLGTGTKQVRTTATVDETTGRTTGALTEIRNQAAPTTWDEKLKQTSVFDAAGNVLSVAETSGGSMVANECFKYDGLRELTEAWTTTAAACQSTPTQAAVGGADPYWTSYQYQMTTGNRATQTQHAAGGDVVRTYTYPASGASAIRPHTITGVAVTGAATGNDSYTYDNAGNLQTRSIAGGPSQSLTWDVEDRLATVVDGNGTTAYTYDANGGRLVAADPQGTTVYLAGHELRRQGSTTTATRFYNGAAVRTASGLTWMVSDRQGTGLLAVNAATLVTTRRRLDPFGNARTTVAVPWPAARGFVGGVVDNTGLVHLGAREYEAGTGRFISDDAITDLLDPQQINGYAYAGNSPVTSSDPSGLRHDDQYYPPGQKNDSAPVPRVVKPKVKNPKLQSIIDDLYRDNGSRADGTTAGALEEEMRTGEQTMSMNNQTGQMEGTWHYDKAANKAAALAGLLRENELAKANGQPPVLTADEEQIAKAELKRLWSALNTEMPDEMKRYYTEPKRAEALKNQLKAVRENKYIADVTGAEVEVRTYPSGKTGYTMKAQPAVEGAARFFLLLDVVAFAAAVEQNGWDAAISGWIYMWIGDAYGVSGVLCPPPAGTVNWNCQA